jgi:hypothetical protein
MMRHRTLSAAERDNEIQFTRRTVRALADEHADRHDAAARFERDFLRLRLGMQVGLGHRDTIRRTLRTSLFLRELADDCPADRVLAVMAADSEADDPRPTRRGRPSRERAIPKLATAIARRW